MAISLECLKGKLSAKMREFEMVATRVPTMAILLECLKEALSAKKTEFEMAATRE